MNDNEGMGFNWGSVAGAVAPVAGAIYGMFQNKDAQDRRQIKQQQKLTDMQQIANQQNAQHTADLQYDMWLKTNYGPQVEQMEKAGLNPALMYGMGSGGGGTTGGASAAGVSGGSAANAAQTQANELQMGMQLAQIGMMKAQTEKTAAETDNLKAGTENTTLQTDTGRKTQEATIQTATETAAKALADAVRSQQEQVITEETMKDRIKAIQEGVLNQIIKNEGESIENKKKQAELAVKQFEAEMAKSGISPQTPWYYKLITDQLEKYNLNFLK